MKVQRGTFVMEQGNCTGISLFRLGKFIITAEVTEQLLKGKNI